MEKSWQKKTPCIIIILESPQLGYMTFTRSWLRSDLDKLNSVVKTLKDSTVKCAVENCGGYANFEFTKNGNKFNYCSSHYKLVAL